MSEEKPPDLANGNDSEEITVTRTAEESLKARITIVETLYHQIPREEPTEVTCRFSKELHSKEDPYQRRKLIGKEWQPLGFGWLSGNVGMVSLINDAGKERQGIPSEEEKAALALQVIRIRFSKGSCGDLVVPPGESIRFRPHTEGFIELCCSAGEVRYRLFVTPR